MQMQSFIFLFSNVIEIFLFMISFIVLSILEYSENIYHTYWFWLLHY